ncbi:reverse transcriptase domain-containing protein [Tanacetum coccineum]
MTGVSRHMAEHRLNVREGCPPVRQKKMGQAPERNKAIQEEVEKLDGYPLPEIDWKVESLCGYPFKCFLDAYKGYHQIKMAEEDEEKNSIHHKPRDILLHKDVVRPKECWGNLSTFNKADAVLSLPSSGCVKDIQKLNGKLASLNKFLSKSVEKSLSFFKTLKKCTNKSDFQWTQEAKVAFKQMKKLITELPMLTALKEKEELIMYLATAKEAISEVLMTERGDKQLPVASRRLKRYFQAHTIVVITDQPIRQLLSKSKISGRMLKWKFELEGYDIQYRPRISIKGQILADFIMERPEEESPDELMAEPEELPEPWTLFTDGSSCIDGSGAGMILTNPEGVEFTYAMRFRFEATNNEAEYEALIAGLRIAEQMGVKN